MMSPSQNFIPIAYYVDRMAVPRRSKSAAPAASPAAAAMEASQSFVARLESTATDTKISTVDRYAESLGFIVQYHLIPLAQADGSPAVVVHA